MGKKKTKTETSTKPIYAAEVEGAARELNNAYTGQKGALSQVSNNALEASNDAFGRFRDGDSTINAARGYLEGQLNGDPTQNPYLDQMVAQSNDSVRNQMQAQMGTRGLTGSSDYYGLISKGINQNELGMRYSDYDRAMQRKAQAAGMAPGIVAGEYIPLSAAMQAGGQGAMLPIQAAAANAAGTGGLLGQYTNQKGTQTTSPGFMDYLGMGLQAASMFSDARLKENVRRVGKTDGGLSVYTYNYKGDTTPHMGVMAQEVAKVQPEALGPVVGGYKTVRYGEVR